MPKITNYSILNSGSTLNLPNLVGVCPRNIHTKFEANPCIGLRDVKMGYYIVTYSNTQ